MQRVRAGLLVLMACGCTGTGASSPSPSAVQNATAPAPPQLRLAPDQPLGWIGMASAPHSWMPDSPAALVVPLPAEGLATGATVSAIGTRGGLVRVTAGAPTKVPFGCDQHALDVLPFTGPHLPPGVVWVLPPTAPASWRPTPLAIASPSNGSATAAHRRDTVGPLTLELTRTDATHGTLEILRDGRRVHTLAIERSEMAGADPSPIDLASDGVAVPHPVGAWSIAGGPILLVLRVASYEGLHLDVVLVEDTAARVVEPMGAYLYACAF